MKVTDLKYGKGVEVSAIDNSQLKLYALGSWLMYDPIYDIEEIEMTIYQPRKDNISSSTISAVDLLAWAENEVKHAAEKAFKGEGQFVPGPHCQFCRAKARCRAFSDRQNELAGYDFKQPDLLTDDEVSDVLDRLSELTSWAKSVKDYAIREAVLNKKSWPGYKVVEGKSNRKYIAEAAAVVSALKEDGFTEDQVTIKSLLPITAMEKLVTKKVFAKLEAAKLVVKPTGKPALAPLSDKRPEFNSPDVDFDDDYTD
jgi:hypothetical protein